MPRYLDANDLAARVDETTQIRRTSRFSPVEDYLEPDIDGLSMNVPTQPTDRFQRLIETVLLVTFTILATLYFF